MVEIHSDGSSSNMQHPVWWPWNSPLPPTQTLAYSLNLDFQPFCRLHEIPNILPKLTVFLIKSTNVGFYCLHQNPQLKNKKQKTKKPK